VTCRVLKIARQPYYRWLRCPVTDAELVAAYRANALFNAHRDDPEFGYRFLLDEARDAGEEMAERTAWKICSDLGWWSVFRKKRGRNGKKLGPPVHDDLVERDFTADAANRLWLGDITEHWTREGKPGGPTQPVTTSCSRPNTSAMPQCRLKRALDPQAGVPGLARTRCCR
jgi:putative transposase